MFRALRCSLLATALAGTITASAPAHTAEPVASDFIPFLADTFLVLQPAVLTVGEQRDFRIESHIESTIPQGTAPERSVRTVRIEVVRISAGNAVLALTTLSSEGSAFPKLQQALVGRRFEYQASADGYPVRFKNWPKYREAIVGALKANGGEGLVPFLEPMTEGTALVFVLADAAMIGAMQSPMWRGKARTDDAPKTPAPGAKVIGYSMIEGYRASDCTFGYRRVSELDPNSTYAVSSKSAEMLDTLATISMVDGWVVRLRETAVRSRGVGAERVERIVTRSEAATGSCSFKPATPKPLG